MTLDSLLELIETVGPLSRASAILAIAQDHPGYRRHLAERLARDLSCWDPDDRWSERDRKDLEVALARQESEGIAEEDLTACLHTLLELAVYALLKGR